MAPKKLESDSVYAKYDTDGDGVVSDVELSMSERLQKLEVMHESRRTEEYVLVSFVGNAAVSKPCSNFGYARLRASSRNTWSNEFNLLRVCRWPCLSMVFNIGMVKRKEK